MPYVLYFSVCTLGVPAHSYTARCVMQPDSELSPDEQQVAGLVFLSEDVSILGNLITLTSNVYT